MTSSTWLLHRADDSGLHSHNTKRLPQGIRGWRHPPTRPTRGIPAASPTALPTAPRAPPPDPPRQRLRRRGGAFGLDGPTAVTELNPPARPALCAALAAERSQQKIPPRIDWNPVIEQPFLRENNWVAYGAWLRTRAAVESLRRFPESCWREDGESSESAASDVAQGAGPSPPALRATSRTWPCLRRAALGEPAPAVRFDRQSLAHHSWGFTTSFFRCRIGDVIPSCSIWLTRPPLPLFSRRRS